MQKCAHLVNVDLEKCCQTHISIQNFVLVQARTSPPKICKILQHSCDDSRVRASGFAGDSSAALRRPPPRGRSSGTQAAYTGDSRRSPSPDTESCTDAAREETQLLLGAVRLRSLGGSRK